MVKFDCSNQGLTTLEGIKFPENVTELHCGYNDLRSLEYIPFTVELL